MTEQEQEDAKWETGRPHTEGRYFTQWWALAPPFSTNTSVLLRNDGKYVVSPQEEPSDKRDIGPYDTLEEAKAVLLVMHRMGEKL